MYGILKHVHPAIVSTAIHIVLIYMWNPILNVIIPYGIHVAALQTHPLYFGLQPTCSYVLG